MPYPEVARVNRKRPLRVDLQRARARGVRRFRFVFLLVSVFVDPVADPPRFVALGDLREVPSW